MFEIVEITFLKAGILSSLGGKLFLAAPGNGMSFPPHSHCEHNPVVLTVQAWHGNVGTGASSVSPPQKISKAWPSTALLRTLLAVGITGTSGGHFEVLLHGMHTYSEHKGIPMDSHLE